MKNDMVSIEVPELEEYPQMAAAISGVLGVPVSQEQMMQITVALGQHKFAILKMVQTPQQVAAMAMFLLKAADQRPVDWPKNIAEKIT